MNLFSKTDEVALELLNKDWFSYINDILKFVSTFALIAILLLTTISLALDLVYLVFPFAKSAYDEFVENKQGNKAARAVVRLLVSKIAIQSFEEATEHSKPVMWVYMKNSIVHYVTTVVLVVILATGLDTILMVVYKLIRGFLSQL